MSDLYDITKEETRLKHFVQNNHQEAVVYKLVTRMGENFVYCYSPVWGDLFIRLCNPLRTEEEDLHRGDIVVVARGFVNDDEKERYITRGKYYFLGILWLKIKEYRYNTEYYLFGFIPTIKITKYPELARSV